MCGQECDQVRHSTKWFICGTHVLAVDAPCVPNEVSLIKFGLGFHCCIASFQFVSFLLMIAHLKNGGGSIHGQFNVENGEFCVLCILLHFFHGKDEVRHACSSFVEEEHV